MAKREMTSASIVEACKGRFDNEGTIWNERVFSHPERTIRVATSFSGIGAPEKALERLGLKTQIVFACDIGERYLKYNYKRLKEFIREFSDDDKEEFVKSIWKENKAEVKASREKKARNRMRESGIEPIDAKSIGINELTQEDVRDNLLNDIKDKDTQLQLTERCIELICKYKGLTERSEIEAYVSSLYDEKGVNWQKETFFANHDIDESAWHTDIRFMNATPYRGKVDLYVGGSPCQSYSRSGKRLALADMRGTLFYQFAKRIEECQPKVFIYENVKGMMNAKEGEKSGLECALEAFTELGYKVYWQVLDAKDYGMPQHRERIWVVGFREDVEFTYPASIPLTTRMYDYLDEELVNTYDGIPYRRHLTGKECMRLMGFTDFKEAPKMQSLESACKRDRLIFEMAGNSMVVDCLMALFRQMDITKYGEELPETKKEIDMDTADMDTFSIEDRLLYNMSVTELAELINRASNILNCKLKTLAACGDAHMETQNKECGCTCEGVSQQVDESEVWDMPEYIELMDSDEPEYEGVFDTSNLDGFEFMDTDDGVFFDTSVLDEVELMDINEHESEDIFDTSQLGGFEFMDTTGRPVGDLQIIGARISNDTKRKREGFRKDWFVSAGDLEGYYERLREGHDAQWNRVFSVNGICPTITTTEQPVILVCNEGPTCTGPYDLETEPELYEQIEVESLW